MVIVCIYILYFTPIGISIGEVEKRLREQDVAAHGLGVITAAIFLAGEMAGSGVLALPSAMVGTGNIYYSFLAIQYNYENAILM